MSVPNAAPRTALSPHVAAEGNAIPSFSFEQMERMANSIAKSGLFGVRTPDQALALMLISQAEGRHPALSALEYHVIQGKPTLKADTQLSRYLAAGGTVKWLDYTDEKVSAVFTHPQSGAIKIEWTIERAKKVQQFNNDTKKFEALTDKLNWRNYPRAMLRSRTISEGVRASYPGVTVGRYTPEELEDGVVEIDVTPVSIDEAVTRATEVRNPLTAEECEEHLKAMKAAPDLAALALAFSSAWTHATEAKDIDTRNAFKKLYDGRKEELGTPKEMPS